jgi:hypothetical protein
MEGLLQVALRMKMSTEQNVALFAATRNSSTLRAFLSYVVTLPVADVT